MVFTLLAFGQIVGLIGFVIIFSTSAVGILFPETTSLSLTLLFFVGMFFVVLCACANVEIPKS